MATRKTATVAQVDLSGPVTFDQYVTVLNALWAFAKTVARNAGWCSSWVHYVRSISTDFPNDRSAVTVTPEQAQVFTIPDEYLSDAGRAYRDELQSTFYRDRLTEIRGRLGYYASENSGQITLDTANEALRSAGLPEFEMPAKPGHGYYVYAPNLVFRSEHEGRREAWEEWSPKLAEALSSAGFELQQGYTIEGCEVQRLHEGNYVPTDQTVQPLNM